MVAKVNGREPAASAAGGEFEWKYFSRFVTVSPVRLGWLVIWGRYEEMGQRTVLLGNRTYRNLAEARHRLQEAVLELTRKPALAAEAAGELDRYTFVPHEPAPLPDPL